MSISFDPNISASVYKALYNYDNKQKKRSNNSFRKFDLDIL